LSRCPQCGIALVVHPGKDRDILLCHQCGRVFGIPTGCSHCGNTALQYSGAGTARIEAVVKALYPGRRVIRIDRDTTAGKGDFAELHEQFQSGQADILVGTQIVAKGLDYENIGLVGILDADAGLNIPDFRAAERSFQLLQQVVGRAGRRGQSARVVLQTRLPAHPLFAALQAADTVGFYEQELKTRERFFLPPFSRIAKLIYSARTKETAYRRARQTEAALRLRLQEKPALLPVELSVAPALNPQKHGKYFVNLLITAREPERVLALVALSGARVDIDPADVVS
jgi:primosomal protein N' (replication factor Y)